MKSEDFYKTYLQYPQICTDSRKVKPGCLYFSLKGNHFDGNRFAADALAKGCAYAIVDDPSIVADHRYILVPDALGFMQDLASFHRSNLSIPVIGLTGTNGKTTTKELIHSVLKQKFNVVATSGNFNNHIGVPITLLATNTATEILIVEMGANHPGEIAFLCDIAKPDIGLITNIGKAHLEGFGSFDGVVLAKNELYNWIKLNRGKLFVNEDDELLKKLVEDYPCFTYGTSGHADVCGLAANLGRYLSVQWKTRGGDDLSTLSSHLTGVYNLYNILAAISIGIHFGLDKDQIRAGIESYVPDNMRSQWIQTIDNVLFLDSYNANPSSMSLAIEHFASLGLPHPVAILGDMFELGSHAADEHLKIIHLAGQLGFEKVMFAGIQFYQFAADFPHLFFENLNNLKDYLAQNKLKGCDVLIKGSRGMQLEELVGYL
ncbi:MAG: UDP-N-acetylmuramoyl-tripeptide--D-alanyl-D-alanine ligase [Bacteroidia bacterium]|nr:UDP-N-acetylmuramoyl-tripeptide--D-alanyl-D-alanine ligase [Bacteroidia bacterium]